MIQVQGEMLYVLRTGCPWRDLPGRYGSYTTVYNRFRRLPLSGVWDRIMDAVVDAHNGDVVTIPSRQITS